MTNQSPEIPETLENPPQLRVRGLARAQGDSIGAGAAEAVNNALANVIDNPPAPPKRGPGRPPGSTNKKTPPKSPPPPKESKTETERIAESAKDRSHKKDTKEPPDFSEWSDFLGEVVLHWFSVAFIAVAMRGIPYHDIMSDADYEDIQLDDDELKSVARPFAHLLTHSGINTKYGRAIMNSRDSIEASVVLFMWMGRVNRIGKKYRRFIKEATVDVPRIPRPDRVRESVPDADIGQGNSGTSVDRPPSDEEPHPPIGIIRPAFGHGYN